MKTLHHHVLIFDDDCPLCKAYTGAFMKTGMLDSKGREPYSEMSSETGALIDKNRARNEIALLNTKTGQVTYGIESLTRVLGNAWPFFTPLFKSKLFKLIMPVIYAFISYNRKVIAPAKIKANSCVPDVNVFYRWVYIIFTWYFTSLILSNYSQRLEGVVPGGNLLREYLVCGGQIIFQACVLWIVAPKKMLDYLGNMMSISLAGAMLLLFVMFVQNMSGLNNSLISAGIFMSVAGLMFLEHLRRMKRLELSLTPSLSWVIYRIMVLTIIFYIK